MTFQTVAQVNSTVSSLNSQKHGVGGKTSVCDLFTILGSDPGYSVPSEELVGVPLSPNSLRSLSFRIICFPKMKNMSVLDCRKCATN